MHKVLITALVLLLPACLDTSDASLGANPESLNQDGKDGKDGTDNQETVTSNSGTLGCAHRVEPFQPVEVWSGTAGSVSLKLELTQLAPGTVEGRLTLGDAPFRYANLDDDVDSLSLTPNRNVQPGFDYTLLDSSTFNGAHLHAEADPVEVWCNFCEQQTSYPLAGDPSEYACNPYVHLGAQLDPVTGIMTILSGSPPQPIATTDPAEWTACGIPYGVCQCSDSSCWAEGWSSGMGPVILNADLSNGQYATGELIRPGAQWTVELYKE